jgi:hypothetical protein
VGLGKIEDETNLLCAWFTSTVLSPELEILAKNLLLVTSIED